MSKIPEVLETRICTNCGDPIVKRDNENNYRYKTRKYCCEDCYHEYMKREKLGWYAYGQLFKGKEE